MHQNGVCANDKTVSMGYIFGGIHRRTDARCVVLNGSNTAQYTQAQWPYRFFQLSQESGP